MKRFMLLAIVLGVMCGLASATNPPTVVVANVSVIGATDAIPVTVLHTPVGANTFRVSMYIELSNYVQGVTLASQVPCGFISWTGDFGSYTVPPANNGICIQGPNAFVGYVQTIHAAAGQPITFDTVIGSGNTQGTPPISPYNVYVTVERMPQQ